MARKLSRQFSKNLGGQVLPLICSLCSVLFACSQSAIEKEFSKYSTSYENRDALRKVAREDYKVLNSSIYSVSKEIPGWISHPQKYGSIALGKKKSRKEQLFFSFITTPKTNREIACTMARAFTRHDMADFLVKFYREGEESREWDSFLITEGHEYLKEFFKEAVLEKTYWEHREYRGDLGLDGTKNAYVCALLIRVKEESLKSALRNLQNKIIKEFSYRRPLEIKAVQKVLDPDSFILFYKMNY